MHFLYVLCNNEQWNIVQKKKEKIEYCCKVAIIRSFMVKTLTKSIVVVWGGMHMVSDAPVIFIFWNCSLIHDVTCVVYVYKIVKRVFFTGTMYL